MIEDSADENHGRCGEYDEDVAEQRPADILAGLAGLILSDLQLADPLTAEYSQYLDTYCGRFAKKI